MAAQRPLQGGIGAISSYCAFMEHHLCAWTLLGDARDIVVSKRALGPTLTDLTDDREEVNSGHQTVTGHNCQGRHWGEAAKAERSDPGWGPGREVKARMGGSLEDFEPRGGT